jgi:hypothetical protein
VIVDPAGELDSDCPILRSIEELDDAGVAVEHAFHVSSARVALANYELIQRDFPGLGTARLLARNPALLALPDLTQQHAVHSIIDNWLVANAALISIAQTQQCEVNTPISIEGEPVRVFRPPRYGRSLVVSLSDTRPGLLNEPWPPTEGLLDLKGVGVGRGVVPSHVMHHDGLEYLGVALGDYLVKSMIEEIFRRSGMGFRCVPVYAVLDLGFDLRDAWRGTGPAGVHVRRAHRRAKGGEIIPSSGSVEEHAMIEIEMLLRSYGITSTGRMSALLIEERAGAVHVTCNEQPVDGLSDDEMKLLKRLWNGSGTLCIDRINIQLTRDVGCDPIRASMLDFGHINVRSVFQNPVSSVVIDRPFCIGGILWPDDSLYVQPDAALALPIETWSRRVINGVCFDLASRFRAKAITAHDVSQELDRRVQTIVAGWGSSRRH